MIKILVVEDDPGSQLIYGQRLRAWEYDVTVCPDAETALDVYHRTFYPLLIIDVGLPEMNGFELCRRIRVLPQAAQSMILIATAYDQPEDLQAALDAGADDYLLKPISEEQLQVRLTILERQLHNLLERKRTEEALRESERKYRVLFESAREAILAIDADERITVVNPAMVAILGYTSPQELIGKSVSTLYANPEELTVLFKELQAKGYLENYEATLLRKDGTLIYTLGSGLLHFDEKGQILQAEGIFMDITGRKRAEDALRASEQQYRFLVEHVADGIGIIQDEHLVFVNQALASMLETAPEQLNGIPLDKLFRSDTVTHFENISAQAETGATNSQWCVFEVVVTNQGRELWMEGTQSVILWQGKPAILITMRDISQHKLREFTIEQEKEQFRTENIQLKSTIRERYRFGELIGKSAVIQTVYQQMLEAAGTEANVIIYGESGTGKELTAQTIHQISKRRNMPFVPVNCGAIQETVFESEFFGYRKGAFTGAHRDKRGYFDAANGGTLFLDEIGELTLTMQVKLLRALEGKGYTPVGDYTVKQADVRIIAATNRNLLDMVKTGEMREDFFYRLHVVTIAMPPLRERKEDLPLLVDHLFAQFGSEIRFQNLPQAIVEALFTYQWPGNIRELQNALHQYLTRQHLDFFDIYDHSPVIRSVVVEKELEQEDLKYHEALQQFEKCLILRTLERNHWHRTKTAAMLGIPRKTLFRKIKEFGLL
jgi:PAS domain S-box-containing protein